MDPYFSLNDSFHFAGNKSLCLCPIPTDPWWWPIFPPVVPGPDPNYPQLFYYWSLVRGETRQVPVNNGGPSAKPPLIHNLPISTSWTLNSILGWHRKWFTVKKPSFPSVLAPSWCWSLSVDPRPLPADISRWAGAGGGRHLRPRAREHSWIMTRDRGWPSWGRTTRRKPLRVNIGAWYWQ